MARADDIEIAISQRKLFDSDSKYLNIKKIIDILKENSEKIVKDYLENEEASQEKGKEVFELIKTNTFIKKDNIFDIILSKNNKKKFGQKFKGLSSKDKENKACQYVWVSFTENNQILEVGRTSFNEDFRKGYGDVSNKITLLKNKTIDILANLLSQNEEPARKEMKTYFIKDSFTGELREISAIEIIKNIDEDLSNFVTKAIIIPLDISSIPYEKSESVASKLETLIGEYLVKLTKNDEQLMPMIYPKSHLYY